MFVGELCIHLREAAGFLEMTPQVNPNADLMNRAADELERIESERSVFLHDLDRHIVIASEYADANEKLRGALNMAYERLVSQQRLTLEEEQMIREALP